MIWRIRERGVTRAVEFGWSADPFAAVLAWARRQPYEVAMGLHNRPEGSVAIEIAAEDSEEWTTVLLRTKVEFAFSVRRAGPAPGSPPQERSPAVSGRGRGPGSPRLLFDALVARAARVGVRLERCEWSVPSRRRYELVLGENGELSIFCRTLWEVVRELASIEAEDRSPRAR